MHILLCGYGKMGAALLAGWLRGGFVTSAVVIDPHASETVSSAHVFHVRHMRDIPLSFKPDVIVFAVKPQVLGDILPDYREIAPHALCISIIAGKDMAFFEAILGTQTRIVRSMPNTPAAIGHGMTVAVANSRVTDADKSTAAGLLSAVGDFMWADDENLLNPVTALSGSGPAYVFLLIEAMTEAAIKTGLSPEMAARLARQTVIGSAHLAEQSADISPATLRENVTSPGGTTAAALQVLMDSESGIQTVFDRALQAATDRAVELSGNK